MRLFRRLLLASLASMSTGAAVGAAPAEAADIRVLTSGAFRPVLEAIIPAFEARNGSKVVVVNDTSGGVAARISRGEVFDLAILTPATVAGPARDAQVILVTPIASVGVGVAVTAGAPKPDISSSGALRQVLLGATKVAMVDPASGGTSGAYLMTMFDKLGITDHMKPKLVLTPGGLAAERLVNGEATLALGQTSELIAVKGASLVGPLPPDLQSRTTYVAAMNPKASEVPIILLAMLAGPETLNILANYGMGPPKSLQQCTIGWALAHQVGSTPLKWWANAHPTPASAATETTTSRRPDSLWAWCGCLPSSRAYAATPS